MVGGHNGRGAAHLYDLPHELLGGEDELVIDDPLGLRVVQCGLWVDMDRLWVLDGPVVQSLLQLGRVVCRIRGDGCQIRSTSGMRMFG